MRSPTNTKNLFLIVAATGIASVATQIAVLREFLSLFNGNEYTISMIFFSWLFLGGMGTLTAHYAGRLLLKNGGPSLVMLSSILALLAAGQIPLIRAGYAIIFLKGTSQGFYATFFFIFFSMAVYCILLGFVLPFAFQVMRRLDPTVKGAFIYLADNIGDSLGGLVSTFILVKLLTPVQGVFAANTILFGALTWYAVKAGLNKFIRLIPLACCVAATLVLAFEIRTLVIPGGELALYLETDYGRVVVSKQADEFILVTDGIPLFSTKNTAMAEETAHYPLSQLDTANRILVISGLSGLFTEIEKHSPSHIDYVELDKGVSNSLAAFGFIKKSPKMTILNTDGIKFVKKSNKKYSAVLVNLPEPNTFQINRFFTLDFFKQVKSILEPGGVLSFSVAHLPDNLPQIQKRKLSIIKSTLKKAFKNVLIIPGASTFLLASDGDLTHDVPERLKEKGINTLFVENFYSGMVSDFKRDRIQMEITTNETINRAHHPALVSLMFSQWFEIFDTSMAGFALVICLIFFIYLGCVGTMERVLFTTGASLMGIENLVILSYQIAFGNLYNDIGLVISLFLLGLIPGTLLGISMKKKGSSNAFNLITSDLFLALLALGFPLVVLAPGEISKELFHLLYGFSFSAAAAYQVPIVFQIKGEGSLSLSSIFTSDLVGAAVAPLLFTLVMVPRFGVVWTGIAIFILKLISSLTLIMQRKKINLC